MKDRVSNRSKGYVFSHSLISCYQLTNHHFSAVSATLSLRKKSPLLPRSSSLARNS